MSGLGPIRIIYANLNIPHGDHWPQTRCGQVLSKDESITCVPGTRTVVLEHPGFGKLLILYDFSLIIRFCLTNKFSIIAADREGDRGKTCKRGYGGKGERCKPTNGVEDQGVNPRVPFAMGVKLGREVGATAAAVCD
jgi:hypothetical protein